MNHRTAAMGRAVCIVASVLEFTSTSGLAQVNSWINPASGNWDQAANWSLGVLPASSQSVMITNSGFKAVGINPSTPINFPGSMTVSSLTIQGATNSFNTLLLNFFGTAVPLTVLSNLTLRDNAQILELNSSLVVQSGTVTVTNSQINQDGGFIRATNASMNLQNAVYNLTNGDFQGGQVSLGLPVPAQFNQFGGTVMIGDLEFGRGAIGSGGAYALNSGNLSLPGGLTLLDDNNSFSSYFQGGGTNQTTEVMIEPGFFGISPSFTLNGGLLADNDVSVVADDFGQSAVTQNGGTHVVTNLLSLSGASSHGMSTLPGAYNLNGGTLRTGAMSLDSTFGPAILNQSNGTAQVGGEIQVRDSQSPFIWVGSVNLSGGSLACSNLFVSDGGNILQSGGSLTVSNMLSFGGFIQPGPTIYSNYKLFGGTLSASNISVGGIWIIGDSPTNRITNPGSCTLSNRIVISNAVELLGRFILGSNATIDLAGSASKLSFANSSGQTWASGAMLTVTDWNGSLSGGGAEQLKFGTDQSGLTVAQLSQIQFPIGTNIFPAKLLATGEVVPNEGSSNPGLVNSWISPTSGNWDVAANWSLGILPASAQSVMITNAGFKAVAIQPSTPINFPGSMTVSNLTITSPTNSFNTLLMNFVGAGNPLVVGSSSTPGSLIIGSNSAMTMLSSGLIVNNALGASNQRLGAFEVDGTFTQSENSEIVANFFDMNGTYHFTNGMLFVGDQFINGQFDQEGGTNFASTVILSSQFYDFFGGKLSAGSLVLTNGANFNQNAGYNTNGGITITTTTNSFGRLVPLYTLMNGVLETPFINLNGGFDHFGGTNRVGTLLVTNINEGYVFDGGRLVVNQIELSGSPFSDNGGTMAGMRNVTMANGSWIESHATMQLGQLQLLSGTNSLITLLSSPCVLQLADSSGVPWANDGRLTIQNWSGSLNGGGSSQLIFGTSASGLTGQQLGQVQFSNPAGLSPGTYSARILSNGEVVPNQVIAASIAFSREGNNLILTWPTGWTLQSATNVQGPYSDVSGATSPFTNNMTLPQQYFRLRH